MKNIIKQELWRSMGVLWFAILFSVLVIVPQFGASFITIIIVPLVLTLLVFLILVYIRKDRDEQR